MRATLLGEAEQLLVLGCDREHAESCRTLGRALSKGQGPLKPDPAHVFKLVVHARNPRTTLGPVTTSVEEIMIVFAARRHTVTPAGGVGSAVQSVVVLVSSVVGVPTLNVSGGSSVRQNWKLGATPKHRDESASLPLPLPSSGAAVGGVNEHPAHSTSTTRTSTPTSHSLC